MSWREGGDDQSKGQWLVVMEMTNQRQVVNHVCIGYIFRGPSKVLLTVFTLKSRSQTVESISTFNYLLSTFNKKEERTILVSLAS
jgi:hypothetical protein